MKRFIQHFNEQSFDFLTWRNGSVLEIFGIKQRYEPICQNRDIIRKYATGWCKSDNIPCRPKMGQYAVMFETPNSCNSWWTHFTEREFEACFGEDNEK